MFGKPLDLRHARQLALNYLAEVCGRGVKQYTVEFKTPREWIEWRVGGRCVSAEPRPPVGGLRYGQLQRRRKIERKRPGINYRKQGFLKSQPITAMVLKSLSPPERNWFTLSNPKPIVATERVT